MLCCVGVVKTKTTKVRRYFCYEVNIMCVCVHGCEAYIVVESMFGYCPNVYLWRYVKSEWDDSKRKYTDRKRLRLTFATSLNIVWGVWNLSWLVCFHGNENLAGVSISMPLVACVIVTRDNSGQALWSLAMWLFNRLSTKPIYGTKSFYRVGSYAQIGTHTRLDQ